MYNAKGCLPKSIPIRHVIVIWTFLGLALINICRSSMGVAMVQMAPPPLINDTSHRNVSTTKLRGEFHWDYEKQGLILSSGNFLSGVGCLVAGRLSEVLGAKLVLGGSIGITSFLQAMTPIVSRLSIDGLVALRTVQGFFSVSAIVTFTTVVSRWIPKNSRSTAMGIINSGSRVGNVIGLLLTQYISAITWISEDTWSLSFYVYGGLGIVWYIIWLRVMYETPSEHPRISDKELNYILTSQGDERARKNRVVPWKKMLTSGAVWAVVCSEIGEVWGINTLSALLPLYLSSAFHQDAEQSGAYSSLPYILQVPVMWIASFLCDWLMDHKIWKPTVVRKIMCFVGALLPAIFLIVVSVIKPTLVWALVLISVAVGCNGFAVAGARTCMVDIAPDFSGTISGIANFVARTISIPVQYIAGTLLAMHLSVDPWSIIFGLSALVYGLGGVTYLLFGSSDLQPWAVEQEPTTEKIRENGFDMT